MQSPITQFWELEIIQILCMNWNILLNTLWAPHCKKKIGDMLIVFEQVQIICWFLGIRICWIITICTLKIGNSMWNLKVSWKLQTFRRSLVSELLNFLSTNYSCFKDKKCHVIPKSWLKVVMSPSQAEGFLARLGSARGLFYFSSKSKISRKEPKFDSQLKIYFWLNFYDKFIWKLLNYAAKS